MAQSHGFRPLAQKWAKKLLIVQSLALAVGLILLFLSHQIPASQDTGFTPIGEMGPLDYPVYWLHLIAGFPTNIILFLIVVLMDKYITVGSVDIVVAIVVYMPIVLHWLVYILSARRISGHPPEEQSLV